MSLPCPSYLPNPFLPRPTQHQHRNHSDRSFAETSSARSSSYASPDSDLVGDRHIHVASRRDDSHTIVSLSADHVLQLPDTRSNSPSILQTSELRDFLDGAHWAQSYSNLSSPSPFGGDTFSANSTESDPVKLQKKPSYDASWHAVDEREEIGMSEEDTDDDHLLEETDDEEKEEERTSAVVIAEEGRGLIVHGSNVPVIHLHAQPGTTHLLIGSSSTPNAMPAFLTTTLPQICNTLLALDISANFLGALPTVLAICHNLEELNIACNPLRVLPVFLADLTNLRVLIADSTGISTLPDTVVELDKLHTISVRKNKFNALPSWLCLLPALQTLCVDGNAFHGPWKALVEPLLSKPLVSPLYPLPTSSIPLASPENRDFSTCDDTDTDDDTSNSSPSSAKNPSFHEDDHTITLDRLAPVLGRSITSPLPLNSSVPSPPCGLSRTRTTPNRPHARDKTSNPTSDVQGSSDHTLRHQPSVEQSTNRDIRKMKSVGDLRRSKPPNIVSSDTSSFRKSLSRCPASVSSSNLPTTVVEQEIPDSNMRFSSMGSSSAVPGSSSASRSQVTLSLWETADSTLDPFPTFPDRLSQHHNNLPSPPKSNVPDHLIRNHPSKDVKDRVGSRWGFLKKMSMGKMKSESPPPPLPQNRLGLARRPHALTNPSSPPASLPATPAANRVRHLPQIDVRFSTTGILESLSHPSLSVSDPSPQPESEPSKESSTSFASPSSFLAPPKTPRPTKRRSFLPVDAPGTMSLILSAEPPSTHPIVPADDKNESLTSDTPAGPPVDAEQFLHREEERTREAYTRALRSVMAYLKDMNDLGLSQQSNISSIYGAATDEVLSTRSRRPTMVDGGQQRESSMASVSSPTSAEPAGNLRSMESIGCLRSGNSAQTLSVATTDSASSCDERKFKDDKGKRAMIVREIVATERTYVKGLQELVDIYIKPSSVPVNILSGSGKETIVPASERKVVFGGIDALFSFHKDNFLPALEKAASPLMTSPAEPQQVDADGQLSLDVVRAVGNIFLRHAAFMKMYSSYINNFDNAVQRVKYWTSDRNTSGFSNTVSSNISPSSSTVQAVGLGLSMSSVVAPGLIVDGGTSTGVPNLTTSQRKRVRAYLKRSRLNPRHSQLNLEGYLLLPVQRIPRYRLLLEELLRCTPPTYEYMDDLLDRSLAEISSLAINMNEGKRESESRRKLVQWQSRIRGKFPSPLVQPHRRLIMDGPLLLTRVVRKAMVSFEAINAQGDASAVQVDCLAPELTPRTLIGILCNDLLVLCRDPLEGKDPSSSVDLWAVLRMQTLPQPASIVHGNVLRLVDNKAILYFDAPSPSDALNWYRAINLHIPASKT